MIAHLLNWLYDGDMKRTLHSGYGNAGGQLCAGHSSATIEPGDLYCGPERQSAGRRARGTARAFIASDIPALLEPHPGRHSSFRIRRSPCMNRQGISVFDAYEATHCHHPVCSCGLGPDQRPKRAGMRTICSRRCHEQPEAARKHVRLPGWMCRRKTGCPSARRRAKRLKKITIVACGTAYHAGIYRTSMPSKSWRASRWRRTIASANIRYRDPIIGRGRTVHRRSPRAVKPPIHWRPFGKSKRTGRTCDRPRAMW